MNSEAITLVAFVLTVIAMGYFVWRQNRCN